MTSISKCDFLAFLCLAILLTLNLAEAQDRSKLIPIGPCAQIPNCSQTCKNSGFTKGGQCIKWYPNSIKYTCACFVNAATPAV
uniref:Knottin scorpion toxin-like domain-containing protein n=1 Tax=Brassica oleracea var. oleracea TaxID=109376 RepID=A0A0D3B440_BRAOL